MGQDPGTSGPQVTESQDPEQIREQIEETRQELGDTVEALSAKTDVKAQVGRKVDERRPALISAGAAAALGVAGLIAWRLLGRPRGKR